MDKAYAKVTSNKMASASRLPAIMGLSKYSTPNDELQVSIDALAGKEPKAISSEVMEWGSRLERTVLAEAVARLELVDAEFEHPIPYLHDSLPLACSLDGIAYGTGQIVRSDPERGIYVVGQESIELIGMGVLEAKVTSMMPEDVLPLHRGPIQLQAQMDIMKAKWGAVAVLYGGTCMRIFLFAPHQKTLQSIAWAVGEFQGKLDKYQASGEIDWYAPASDADAQRVNPVAVDKEIDLPLEAEGLATNILIGKKMLAEAEAMIDDASAKLKMLLGDAKAGSTGRYRITWPMRQYKAQPERVIAAKPAYSVRVSTIQIKEVA